LDDVISTVVVCTGVSGTDGVFGIYAAFPDISTSLNPNKCPSIPELDKLATWYFTGYSTFYNIFD